MSVSNVLAKLYRHIWSDGTIDQLEQDRMIILVLNLPWGKGIIKRKSAGTLYARNIVYLNTLTGYHELVEPSHWSNLDCGEIKDALERIDARRKNE